MADNLAVTPGSGATVGADEIASVKYQRIKLIHGADGTNDGDVSTANPFPVELTDANNTVVADIAAIKTSAEIIDNAISGSEMQVDVVTSALPTGAATAANQSTANSYLSTLAGAVSGTEMQVDIVAALPAGTNAIGKLAENDGVDIGDVDVTSQPARAATADNVGVALMTNVIHNGTTALTPKFAVIDDASSGDNTIIAAVASKKIRVLACFLVAADAVTVRFEDGAGGTALTGQMNVAANGGFVLPFNPVGWFETSVNTLLNLELSGAISVDGSITYVEV